MYLQHTTPHLPEIGLWYQLPDQQIFKIIAMDSDDETIEIQYFDGAIEEWDTENWYRSDIETIEAPEDWSGPYDEMEYDDLGYDELMALPRICGNPLDTVE